MHPKYRRLEDESGQAMVEFAVVLPLLALLLFGIIQFGITFNNYVTLTDAVRAGARQAAIARYQSDPVGFTTTKVIASAQGLALTADDVTVTTSDAWAPGSSVTVKAVYPYSIDLLGLVLSSGTLSSSTTERVE